MIVWGGQAKNGRGVNVRGKENEIGITPLQLRLLRKKVARNQRRRKVRLFFEWLERFFKA